MAEAEPKLIGQRFFEVENNRLVDKGKFSILKGRNRFDWKQMALFVSATAAIMIVGTEITFSLLTPHLLPPDGSVVYSAYKSARLETYTVMGLLGTVLGASMSLPWQLNNKTGRLPI